MKGYHSEPCVNEFRPMLIRQGIIDPLELIRPGQIVEMEDPPILGRPGFSEVLFGLYISGGIISIILTVFAFTFNAYPVIPLTGAGAAICMIFAIQQMVRRD